MHASFIFKSLNHNCMLLPYVQTFADTVPFDFTCLLHTYFRVPDVSKTTISGLGGLKYVDKVGRVYEEREGGVGGDGEKVS